MEALETAEHALRLAIRQVMGEEWLESPSAPAAPLLESRRANEAAKRPGVEVSTDLLDFAYTGDLRKIILENQTKFGEVFTDFEAVSGFLAFIDSVRNTVAHNRPLAFYEREALSGMAGLIRNTVSTYRANREPVNRFYPLIESVRDSHGAAGMELDQLIHTFFDESSQRTIKRLELGEEVVFDCRAWDHQQDRRQIQWALITGDMWIEALLLSSGSPTWFSADEKGNASLTWRPSESEVCERLGVAIVMRHSGNHHRVKTGHAGLGRLGYDDVRYFAYAVNPPLD